jgi:hypothetical protein
MGAKELQTQQRGRSRKSKGEAHTPMTCCSKPFLPSLGQGEESKWMRTYSEGEF